jgi:hypothetical protein
MEDGWAPYLQPGETLLWEGAPKPGVHGWPKIIGLAIFGLPFLVFGLVFVLGGIKEMLEAGSWSDFGLGFFFAIFAIPFAAAGAAMVFGQWYAATEAHRKIRYAVSTQCSYIARSYWKRSIESYPILPGTALGLEKGPAADTVWFHVRTENDSDSDRTTTRISFDNIAEGDDVCRILRSIQTERP